MCLDLKEFVSLKFENYWLKYENEDLKKKINLIVKLKEFSIENFKESDKDMYFYIGFLYF